MRKETIHKLNLYLGDCMEYMKSCKDNEFDLAIVDPPYGIGISKNPVRQKHAKKNWDVAPNQEYFNELKRVSKNQIVWGNNNFGIKGGGIVWNKLGTDTTRRKQAPTLSDCEVAHQSFDKRIKMFSFTYQGNVVGNDYQIQWNKTTIHPTQKPVELYEWLLTNYAKPDQKIIDTHLGSGSSAIAAHYFGCEFTGIEIDEDYFNASIQRIKDQTRQINLFKEA